MNLSQFSNRFTGVKTTVPALKGSIEEICRVLEAKYGCSVKFEALLGSRNLLEGSYSRLIFPKGMDLQLQIEAEEMLKEKFQHDPDDGDFFVQIGRHQTIVCDFCSGKDADGYSRLTEEDVRELVEQKVYPAHPDDIEALLVGSEGAGERLTPEEAKEIIYQGILKRLEHDKSDWLACSACLDAISSKVGEK